MTVNISNMEHIVYLDMFLEEMARVLALGGDCFVGVPNEGGKFLDAWPKNQIFRKAITKRVLESDANFTCELHLAT